MLRLYNLLIKICPLLPFPYLTPHPTHNYITTFIHSFLCWFPPPYLQKRPNFSACTPKLDVMTPMTPVTLVSSRVKRAQFGMEMVGEEG